MHSSQPISQPASVVMMMIVCVSVRASRSSSSQCDDAATRPDSTRTPTRRPLDWSVTVDPPTRSYDDVVGRALDGAG